MPVRDKEPPNLCATSAAAATGAALAAGRTRRRGTWVLCSLLIAT